MERQLEIECERDNGRDTPPQLNLILVLGLILVTIWSVTGFGDENVKYTGLVKGVI